MSIIVLVHYIVEISSLLLIEKSVAFAADVSKNPELLKKLASLVDDGEDFDCPICLSPPSKTVITSCTHIYCQTCIMKILKS